MMRIAGTQVLTSGVVEDDRITLNAAFVRVRRIHQG